MFRFLLIPLSSLAFATAGESLLRFYPSEVLRNEIVEFKPIVGHHFSAEAPQSCGNGRLHARTPRAIKCQFTQTGSTQAVLNICDDKQTFCRPTSFTLKVSDKAGDTPVALTKNQSLNKELHRRMVPGFSEGGREEVIKQAATRGQPVFVMVSTDWCPPCNEAKEYLLSSPAFQRATQNWFKIYVDGDSLAAADWEKAVPYRYFPSFVLLNSKMEEVARYTGELRQEEFEAWAKEVSGQVADPIATLRTRVLARWDGSWRQKLRDLFQGMTAEDRLAQETRLAKWALDQDDRELENKFFGGVHGGSQFLALQSRILDYQIGELERRESAEGIDLKSEKTAKFETLLKATWNLDHWASALAGLCELDVSACKAHFDQIGERVQFLRKRPGLTEAERASALGDEYYYLTEAYQTAGDKAAARNFALKCVEHFDALKQKSFLKISRAGQQGMTACLELAGDFAREERTLRELMKAYPSEPTFMNRMARMYRKQKKYDQALRWIARAEGSAYGYNWFTLQALKTDVLLEMKRQEEARQVVARALAQVVLDGGSGDRNQSLVARLRDLQAKVEKGP
jgi:hypothetical protein